MARSSRKGPTTHCSTSVASTRATRRRIARLSPEVTADVATILLSSFVIRHPVGGVLANNLQWLTGFRRLGHDVYLLEKAGYEDSCFDPERRISSDDPSCG